MKMTVSASYSAVPFMLMVAPSGTTKLLTDSAQPALQAHWMVTGIVAALLSVPNAVTNAGRNSFMTGPGLFRTRTA